MFVKKFRTDLGVAMHELRSTHGENAFTWFQGEESGDFIVRVKGQEILLNREEAGLLQELVTEFLQYT